MRILLDTHIAIWAALDAPKLSAAGRKLILDPRNTLVFSAASLWEMAIKRGRSSGGGAIDLSCDDMIQWCDLTGCTLLAITPSHAAAVESLPPLHGDPFDRLLVAQALSEPLRLLTHDVQLAAYSDTVIVV